MLTQKEAKRLFDYRANRLAWKSTGSGKTIRKRRKGIPNYRRIKINNKLYPTHLLTWLWHYGYWPENVIDHINRDITDNSIENLREVTVQCNARNTGNHKDNKSGVKGVSWCPKYKAWRVNIVVNKKQSSLKYHIDFDEAVLHRLAAEQCLGWEGCDSTSPAFQYAFKNSLTHIGVQRGD